MSSLTCITCQVLFKESALQREHYKSDWHRYNLKRKIAEFPPVTAEEFQRRILLVKDDNNKIITKDPVYCTVCKKAFNTSNSFKNHLESKKHLELIKNNDNITTDISVPSKKPEKCIEKPLLEVDDKSDSEVEEVDSDEWGDFMSENNPIANNNCLFCDHHSAKFTKNVKHMTTAHSFYIPDVEYLVDLKGLLVYLGEKICLGNLCIWCNDRRSFGSMEAAQNHMKDKGHTKIFMEGEGLLEYENFYYYTDISDDAIVPVDDITPSAAVETGSEEVALVLPSGREVYHRSLMKYIKQNKYRPKYYVSGTERNKLNKVMNYYRAIGWTPTKKEVIQKKVRDIHYMNYVQSKYSQKLQVKANKLQEHFRQQVNF